jgi:NAD(P)-dependent dehydrogenase (short-subunit alcohol dehydrogenase family)
MVILNKSLLTIKEVVMSSFENKVVIVTGAAAGIGRESAIEFARCGAKVTLADVNRQGLDETAQAILAVAGESIVVITDVSDLDACANMVDKTIAAFGKLDVIFNNAGISGDRFLLSETPQAMWDKVIAINLTGVFNCTKVAMPELIKAGGGVVINTASVDGLVGMSTIAPYVAAKHGVIGLTKTTALEYSRKGVRCVAICPGYIITEMTESTFSNEEKAGFNQAVPLGRGAKPSEVANFVRWIASDEASYINGSFHQIDGGLLAGMGIVD